jgi:hypothetical protein
MRLSDGDCEGMKLVEEQRARFGGIGGKGFSSELNQRRVTCLVAGGRGPEESMAFDDAAKIFVCHGDRVVEAIEQDGVGGFRAYAGQREQTLAQGYCGGSGQCFERAAEFGVKHGNKRFERRRFACGKAGRTNEFL